VALALGTTQATFAAQYDFLPIIPTGTFTSTFTSNNLNVKQAAANIETAAGVLTQMVFVPLLSVNPLCHSLENCTAANGQSRGGQQEQSEGEQARPHGDSSAGAASATCGPCW
jgi:hypothetical protein